MSSDDSNYARYLALMFGQKTDLDEAKTDPQGVIRELNIMRPVHKGWVRFAPLEWRFAKEAPGVAVVRYGHDKSASTCLKRWSGIELMGLDVHKNVFAAQLRDGPAS